MLKIKSGSEPMAIPAICAMLYGQPGSGKTSAGCTASRPLLIDFDRGAHRSAFISRADRVEVDRWEDVIAIEAKDLEPYDTVVIDTAGRCVEALMFFLSPNGVMNQSKWSKLKTQFGDWLKRVRDAGIDVVLTAHAKEENESDILKLRPDIVGGSKAELYKVCDLIGVMEVEGNQRVCRFAPSDRYLAKAPGGMADARIPNFTDQPTWLADQIAAVKQHMADYQEASRKVAAEVEEWRSVIDAADSLDAINKIVADVKTLEGPVAGPVKKMLHVAAVNLGGVGDKATGQYVAKEEQAA